jgi:hypothetical protein
MLRENVRILEGVGTIILSNQQQRRAQILERLRADKITTTDAAGLLPTQQAGCDW